MNDSTPHTPGGVGSEELMVGNYLLWTATEEIVQAFVIGLNGISYLKPGQSIATRLDYDQVSAIPLTEDWLKKFRFIDYGGNIFYTEFENNGMRFYINLDNNCIRLSTDNNFYSSPQLPIRTFYVHQLQNLYFALTQTHLTHVNQQH